MSCDHHIHKGVCREGHLQEPLVRESRLQGNSQGFIILGTLRFWVCLRVWESIAVSSVSLFPPVGYVKSLIILEAGPSGHFGFYRRHNLLREGNGKPHEWIREDPKRISRDLKLRAVWAGGWEGTDAGSQPPSQAGPTEAQHIRGEVGRAGLKARPRPRWVSPRPLLSRVCQNQQL